VNPTLLALFLQGAGFGLSAGASPGPLQTLLISESLLGGFRRGAPIAFAPLVTDVPIVLLMLFVLKQLPPLVLRVLSLAGGLYVLYLAWSVWRQWRAGAGRTFAASSTQANVWVSLRRGALTNFLNPNPYLFWGLVTGPILIDALNQSALQAAAFLIGFYGVMIGVFLILALIFHHARRLGPRIVRGSLLISSLVLIVFGALLIKQGLIG
jgi:threonine/homoserine/homoserine lactone efflux protein